MKKLVLVLMAGGLLLTSCGSVTDETTEAATEAANTEAVESNEISISDLMIKTYDDEVPVGEVITLTGWHAGVLGRMDSDVKTLYVDEKQGSNNASIEAILAEGEAEKLEGTNSDNQIKITGEFQESTGFGTHVILKDCKVIEIL